MKPTLIIAAHGSSVKPASAQSVAAAGAQLAERASIREAYADVEVRFLKQAPLVIDLRPDGDYVVVPYFMSDGYFVSTVLPRELPRTARITAPLGTADLTAAALELCPIAPATAHLVLVGHGTERNPRSADTTFALADRLRPHFIEVHCSFVDQTPDLGTTWQRVPADAAPVIVLPFFAFPGPHTEVDIPEGLGLPDATQTHQVAAHTVHYLPPIGTTAGAVDAIEQLALRLKSPGG